MQRIHSSLIIHHRVEPANDLSNQRVGDHLLRDRVRATRCDLLRLLPHCAGVAHSKTVHCCVLPCRRRLALRRADWVRKDKVRQALQRRVSVGPCNKKAILFWSFLYVCPEPVLVKRAFLYINGSKRPFFHLRRRCHLESRRPPSDGRCQAVHADRCAPPAPPTPAAWRNNKTKQNKPSKTHTNERKKGGVRHCR